MLELTDKAFIIAEAGTCHASPDHSSRVGHAMRYVEAANDAGADCVKFQMFSTEDLLFCPYDGDEHRNARWKDSVLGLDEWRQVKEFTEACGMVFLASVFQNSTVKMLKWLNVEAVKVASRAAKNFPYDEIDAQFLISTGMGYPKGRDAIYLQCEANYPSTAKWRTPCPVMIVDADMDVSAIKDRPGGLISYPVNAFPGGITYIDKPVGEGFSDHSGTPWRAIDAISRGCRLVEVHFYIDPMDAGPDLPASLNLDQLKLVCEARDAFNELRSDE